jgi:hypothetical protein
MIRYPERQYDMVRTHNFHVTLPHAIPYRLNAQDYVFFSYPSDFPNKGYKVIVESSSNASPNPMDRFRDIGFLSPKVELPDVYFSQGFGGQARIGLVPIDPRYGPPFMGNLVRGSTYTIDGQNTLASEYGHIALKRTGVH